LDKPKLIKEGAMQFKMVFAAMLMAGAVGAASAQNFGDVSLKAAQDGAKDMPSQTGVPVVKQAGAQQPLALAFAEEDKTPFQILEALYEAGQPMPLADFPTLDQIKSWDCSSHVGNTDSRDRIGLADGMFARVPVVLTPGIDPQPAVGPEFPGTPGTPAVLGSYVKFVRHNENPSSDDLTAFYNAYKIKEIDSPGVILTVKENKKIQATESFSKNGNLVISKVFNDGGGHEIIYNYCWQNVTSK
jgi:hypothetical protein